MSSTTSDGAVVVAMEISAWTLELGEDEMGLEKWNQERSYYLILLQIRDGLTVEECVTELALGQMIRSVDSGDVAQQGIVSKGSLRRTHMAIESDLVVQHELIQGFIVVVVQLLPKGSPNGICELNPLVQFPSRMQLV